MPARILAAADCYHIMTESRADRDAFHPTRLWRLSWPMRAPVA
jgi:hypothetical protein